MNCKFCNNQLNRYNPPRPRTLAAYCSHCQQGVIYYFQDKMTLEDCYLIQFLTDYYPGYYVAQLMCWSNEIIIHSYIWDEKDKMDKAHLFYRGHISNDFCPQNAKIFMQRIIDLKAFL